MKKSLILMGLLMGGANLFAQEGIYLGIEAGIANKTKAESIRPFVNGLNLGYDFGDFRAYGSIYNILEFGANIKGLVEDVKTTLKTQTSTINSNERININMRNNFVLGADYTPDYFSSNIKPFVGVFLGTYNEYKVSNNEPYLFKNKGGFVYGAKAGVLFTTKSGSEILLGYKFDVIKDKLNTANDQKDKNKFTNMIYVGYNF